MSGTAGTKAKESAVPTALQMLFFEVAGRLVGYC